MDPKDPAYQPQFKTTRRAFLSGVGRAAALLAFGGVLGALSGRARRKRTVWQIDPWKCTACGLCQTSCVLDLSAAKCVHNFPMCGYCKLCFGFFQTNPTALDTGAENQMCPTGAIRRAFVQDPYHQYTIDEPLCNACGKCVKGCGTFGNGSLCLQVRHDRCLNCNECSIAAACPADAFIRLPIDRPYVLKQLGPEQLKNVL
jgi:electron transport complex protein RnfB